MFKLLITNLVHETVKSSNFTFARLGVDRSSKSPCSRISTSGNKKSDLTSEMVGNKLHAMFGHSINKNKNYNL